ncbi:MAG: XRE family transcriptional regulator, partial [Alphaproteobacteria bacterium]|nr:XRE family transcriptional regulator [Alphaproteobacteria bacterium]
MPTTAIDDAELERGSGNVFADLGLPNAEKRLVKAGLVFEIARAMRTLKLTRE